MAKKIFSSRTVPVFTPSSIQSISAGGSLDTSSGDITVIRIPEATDYQINGTGTVATMPAGATGISSGVTSIKFVTAVVVEIM